MTREEQLKFCEICKNHELDMRQGIICGLTKQPADFTDNCSSFIEDAELKQKVEAFRIENELFNKTAGTGKRFLNYILDLVFLWIFSLMIGGTLGLLLAFFSPASVSIFSHSNKLIEYFVGFNIAMLYYMVLEGATGRTIAKFITKTKVVNEKGEKADFGTIAIRTLCRFIPFEAFSFLGSDNVGWHDKISKTRVIENQ